MYAFWFQHTVQPILFMQKATRTENCCTKSTVRSIRVQKYHSHPSLKFLKMKYSFFRENFLWTWSFLGFFFKLIKMLCDLTVKFKHPMKLQCSSFSKLQTLSSKSKLSMRDRVFFKWCAENVWNYLLSEHNIPHCLILWAAQWCFSTSSPSSRGDILCRYKYRYVLYNIVCWVV